MTSAIFNAEVLGVEVCEGDVHEVLNKVFFGLNR